MKSAQIVYCFGEIVERCGLKEYRTNSPDRIPVYLDKHGKTPLVITNNILNQFIEPEFRVHLYKIPQKGEPVEVSNKYFPKTFREELRSDHFILDERHTFPHSGNSKSVLHLVCEVNGIVLDLNYFYLFAEVPKSLPVHKDEKTFAQHNENLIKSKKMLGNCGRPLIPYGCFDMSSNPLENVPRLQQRELGCTYQFGSMPSNQVHGIFQQEEYNVQESYPHVMDEGTSTWDNFKDPDPLMEIEDLIIESEPLLKDDSTP